MTLPALHRILRPLNQMEEALTITGIAHPLVVVCVLRINRSPSTGAIRSALDLLQKAHPLLNATIIQNKSHFWFEKIAEATPIPLVTEKRKGDLHWLTLAQNEINQGFDYRNVPLMRALYLTSDSATGKSEIILCLHHAITDAASMMYIADQLLNILAEFENNENVIPGIKFSGLSPLFKSVLPAQFRNPALWFYLAPFLFRQMKDESRYRKMNRDFDKKEASGANSSLNELHVINFSGEETAGLIKWSREKRITLNSLITASMLLMMNKYLFSGKKEVIRTVQFANLRPYLRPPVEAGKDGSFVSLMRFTIPLKNKNNLFQLASYLDQQFLRSARRGEKFLFFLSSKMAMKIMIRKPDEKMGTTALSYTGPIRLKEQYGNMRLTDVHGFITNNRQSPELSGFGKIFSGRLSLDMDFLSPEISREKATRILEEIKSLLLDVIDEK
jgi:hypothetical protein